MRCPCKCSHDELHASDPSRRSPTRESAPQILLQIPGRPWQEAGAWPFYVVHLFPVLSMTDTVTYIYAACTGMSRTRRGRANAAWHGMPRRGRVLAGYAALRLSRCPAPRSQLALSPAMAVTSDMGWLLPCLALLLNYAPWAHRVASVGHGKRVLPVSCSHACPRTKCGPRHTQDGIPNDMLCDRGVASGAVAAASSADAGRQ